MGGTDDLFSTSATEYNSISNGGQVWDNAEIDVQQVVSTSGTISNLYIDLENVPGSGKSVTFTIMKNGVATLLEVLIEGINFTYGFDLTNSFTVVAGDTLSIRCVPASSPTSGNVRWTMIFDGDTDNESIILGNSAGQDINRLSTSYLPFSNSSDDDTSANVLQVIPTSGTIKNFYIKLENAPGTGNSYDFTLYKNGSSTALTINISEGTTTASNTVNTVTVTAGDTVYIENIPTSGPTLSKLSWGFTFLADTSGESLLLGNSLDDPSNTTNEYIEPTSAGGTALWNTGVLDSQILSQSCTLKNLYVSLENAPGTGNSFQFILVRNGIDTGLTVTISDTATTGTNTTDFINVNDQDLLSLKSVPTSTPTTGNIRWGFVQLALTGNTFTQTDNFSISDVFQKMTKAKKNFIEAVTLTDIIRRNLELSKSESLNLTDIFFKSLDTKKTNTDIFNLNDSIKKTIGVIFSNNIVLEDALTRLVKANKNILEQLFFEDDISLFVLANKILTDETTLEDNVLRKVQAKIAFVENITLTDTFSAIKLRYITLSDNLTLSDILQLKTKAKKQFQENITLTDILNKFVNAQTIISDEIILVDNNSQKIFAKLSLSDEITLDDNLTKQAKVKITALDNFTLTDELIRKVMKSQLLTDLLNLTDSPTATESFRPPYWTFVRVDI